MKKITQYFIDNSFVVNLISVIVLILGLVSLGSMKRDLISNWEGKTIRITAEFIGAGPAQVEKYVTYPLEKAVKGISAVDKISSETSHGMTTITLSLVEDIENIAEVEQEAKDEVTLIEKDLPEGVDNIRVRHIKQRKAWFNYYSILNFDENSDDHQNWILRVKENLSRIKGIASIDTYNWTKSLYLKIKPEALGRYEVSPNEIYRRVRDNFKVYPLGSIKKGANEYSIEIENNDTKNSEQLDAIKNIILRSNSSRSIKLSDVADVQYRLPKRTNRNFTMGKDSISFNVYKDFSADSIELKEILEKKLEAINKSAPDELEIISVEDGPAFIVRQINALKSNAVFGIIIVVLTLCLFLGYRNAVMTSFGLPLAYLFTFIVLENLNISIDLISVVGMLLVIGIIVDDAIIISEQYMQNLEMGMAPKKAALNAVLKTWKPICGAVATTLIAFAPILFGRDSMSSILYAIPVVVFTALGISLLESFFILPNHLAHFVKKPHKKESSKYFDSFKEKYKRLLEFTLKYRYLVLIGFVGVMIGSLIFASKNINFNFNLNISSESIRFIGQLKNSNSVEESRKKIQVIEDVISKIPKERYKLHEVSIGQNYTNGKKMIGPEYFNYWISFSQLDENVNENKQFVKKLLEEKLKTLKKTGLFERLEVKIHKGGRDDSRENIVELTINSMNPFNADAVTKNVKNIIEQEKIVGIKSVDLNKDLFKDAWIFKPNISQIRASGLTLSDVSSQLVLYVRTNEIYEHNLGDRTIKLYSYIEDGSDLKLNELDKLPIFLKNGLSLPINEFGSWVKEKRQGTIKHSNLMRRVVVDLPFDKEKIKKEVLIEKIKKIQNRLVKDYPNLEFSTQDADEQSKKNKSSMLKKFLYALVGIFFVLALVLRSLMQPILICMAIPFGIIGVIWAFYLQGIEVNLMAIIGIIGMAGVVVNDSLLLVVTVNNKRKNWFDFHVPQIIEGSSSRLRAILLTSITTLGGVFPMAYAVGGDAGFTKSLAMSMGWGLLFATCLTLIVLPCMLLVHRDFMVFIKKKILREVHRKADAEINDISFDSETSDNSERQQPGTDYEQLQ